MHSTLSKKQREEQNHNEAKPHDYFPRVGVFCYLFVLLVSYLLAIAFTDVVPTQQSDLDAHISQISSYFSDAPIFQSSALRISSPSSSVSACPDPRNLPSIFLFPSRKSLRLCFSVMSVNFLTLSSQVYYSYDATGEQLFQFSAKEILRMFSTTRKLMTKITEAQWFSSAEIIWEVITKSPLIASEVSRYRFAS